MHQRIHDLRVEVRKAQPLIHCITNPISINQCANAVLALGARPIMAEHPKEAAQITGTAQALLLNLGNITDARMEAIGISAQTAQEANIPMLLDAVGIACSRLRRDYIHGLLQKCGPNVIKGNYSEIHALYKPSYCASGVDAEDGLQIQTIDRAAAALARKQNTVILASGKVDIVTDGKKLVHIHNGTPQLSSITGTGCMLGAICAAYLSAADPMTAAIAACVVLGICGEKAETRQGNGTFFVGLMDALSMLRDEEVFEKIHLEEMNIESI